MRTKTILFFVLNIGLCVLMQAQVGINTTNPQAALDISGNNSGMLLPRMTTAQKDAITENKPGLIVFDTEAGSYNIKQKNNSWESSKHVLEPMRFNKCLEFNGTNQFLGMSNAELVKNNFINKNQVPFTLSFLVKPFSNNKMGLFDLRAEGIANGIHIWIENQNLYINYGNNAVLEQVYKLETINKPLVSNSWNYITITYDGKTLNQNTDNPIKVYIGEPTYFKSVYEDTTRTTNVGNVNIGSGNETRYIQIGRGYTDATTDTYFNGQIAAVSLINRALTDSNELKFFTLSPKGWMHAQHTGADNFTATDGASYDFKIYVPNVTYSDQETEYIKLTAQSNKIWLFGNGLLDGENNSLKNQTSYNTGEGLPVTIDIGDLKFKNITLDNIETINDLNINL